jgi:hypothetical protein
VHWRRSIAEMPLLIVAAATGKALLPVGNAVLVVQVSGGEGNEPAVLLRLPRSHRLHGFLGPHNADACCLFCCGGPDTMRTRVTVLLILGVGMLALATVRLFGGAEPVRQLDADQISQAAGAKATTAPDGVVRIAWARTDVPVQVDGMPLKPFAGLVSWAAFTPSEHGAMVMGDTVVFQDEVTPAMDAAFAAGLEVTALHNHFFYDEPKVYFMHVGGMGKPAKLAAAVKSVWDAIKKVRAENPKPASRFPGQVPKEGKIDQAAIEKVLGQKSEMQAGVVKVTIGREGTMHGVKVGGSMGLTTWAAFSGSDELAAVCGDFIMTAAEVQPVLRTLRKADIHIVALHNHMIGEQPAFYFAHFWGKGPAEKLAKGIKAALDEQAKVSSGLKRSLPRKQSRHEPSGPSNVGANRNGLPYGIDRQPMPAGEDWDVFLPRRGG